MLIGFKKMTISLLDENLQKVVGKQWIIKGDINKGATSTANITGLSKAPASTYGSDKIYFVDAKGHGDINVDFGILDLPSEAEHAILGRDSSGEGIHFIGEETEPPYCAVLLESTDLNGETIGIGFFAGKFSKDAINLETRKKDATELVPDTFNYKPISKTINDKNQVLGIAEDILQLNALKGLCSIVSE